MFECRLQIDVLRELNRQCGLPGCVNKRADTYCRFFNDLNKEQVGWLCDNCVKSPSIRVQTSKEKKDLGADIEKKLHKAFENTGWRLSKNQPLGKASKDQLLGKVNILWEECSVEFQLESEIKI